MVIAAQRKKDQDASRYISLALKPLFYKDIFNHAVAEKCKAQFLAALKAKI